jgi:hypothetical protein
VNRFDLEAAIVDCSRVSDDLKLMVEEISDGAIDATNNCDAVLNALIGIQELHDRRYDRLFNIFEQLIHDGVIS